MENFITGLSVDAFPHIADPDGGIWSDFGIRSQPAFAFINDDGTFDTTGGLSESDLAARVEGLIAA